MDREKIRKLVMKMDEETELLFNEEIIKKRSERLKKSDERFAFQFFLSLCKMKESKK